MFNFGEVRGNVTNQCMHMETYTCVQRVRNCPRDKDISVSTYFAATCKIVLFNIHCDKSKHVKSSHSVWSAVKVML